MQRIGGLVVLGVLGGIYFGFRHTDDPQATPTVVVAQTVPTPSVVPAAKPEPAPPPAQPVTPEQGVVAKDLSAILGADVEYNATTLIAPDLDSKCDARSLVKLRDKLAARHHDASKVFTRLACAGDLGDSIDLSTKDGCTPGMHDQIILSESGVRRDKLANALNDLAAGHGIVITALGCDARVIAVTPMPGTDAHCDRAALEGVRAQSGAMFKQVGFVTMSCDPDGPEIPVR